MGTGLQKTTSRATGLCGQTHPFFLHENALSSTSNLPIHFALQKTNTYQATVSESATMSSRRNSTRKAGLSNGVDCYVQQSSVTLKMTTASSSEMLVSTKLHGVTDQKTTIRRYTDKNV